ncbi:hypothetical protein CLCR_01472 [Cladophialophora carrionii]|uniref:Uncharacterized protein n=1 Tax=Cladophialophora carrionii TaxID=86049 RepID=A0A1C1CAN3_9EURO|nr:hypothetical protein CLCR_01472 [Cladophialophora carrionii]
MSLPHRSVQSQALPPTPTRPRSGIQTGLNVLDLDQFKIPAEFSLSWYTDNLGAVIPDKYRPNRKDITDPIHRILDRASRYHNDTRPPGVEAVTIYDQPAFRTTCRQLASLIPAEYFPQKGSDIVRFFEGVTGYTREKAGMNRYTLPRPNRSSYINPTLVVEAPHSAGLATPGTRRTIKEEPDRDSSPGGVIAGYSEESAINLDSDEEADTILPSVESPERIKKTKSKNPSKEYKIASSSASHNQATEVGNVVQAAEVFSSGKPKKPSSKKRKHPQEGAEAVGDTQLTEIATPVKTKEPSATKKRSKKPKRADEAAEAADNSQPTDFVTPGEANGQSDSKKCSKKRQDKREVAESVSSKSTKSSTSNKRKRQTEVAESEKDAQLTDIASTQSQKSSPTKKKHRRLEEPAGIEGLATDLFENVNPTQSKKSKNSTSNQKNKDCPSGSNVGETHAAPVSSIPQARAKLESRDANVPAEPSLPLLRIEQKRKSLLPPDALPSNDTSSESSVERPPPPVEKPTTSDHAAIEGDNSADDEDETPQKIVRRSTDKLLSERLMAENQALVEKHKEEIAVLKHAAKEGRRRMRERSTARTEHHRRQIACLSTDLARLMDRNQALEDLLCKGAGIDPLDLERTLVRVGEGLNTYRRSFQMVHKCERE